MFSRAALKIPTNCHRDGECYFIISTKTEVVMVMHRKQTYRRMTNRGKYRRLYIHLCCLTTRERKIRFQEIEPVIGFELPTSARLHRSWWSNLAGGSGHSQRAFRQAKSRFRLETECVPNDP